MPAPPLGAPTLRIAARIGNGSRIARRHTSRRVVMQKPITPFVHGVLDYTTAATVAAAPFALGFPKPARRLCESLAAGYTGLSGATDYPLGVVRKVPFTAHGASDVALGLALPA